MLVTVSPDQSNRDPGQLWREAWKAFSTDSLRRYRQVPDRIEHEIRGLKEITNPETARTVFDRLMAYNASILRVESPEWHRSGGSFSPRLHASEQAWFEFSMSNRDPQALLRLIGSAEIDPVLQPLVVDAVCGLLTPLEGIARRSPEELDDCREALRDLLEDLPNPTAGTPRLQRMRRTDVAAYCSLLASVTDAPGAFATDTTPSIVGCLQTVVASFPDDLAVFQAVARCTASFAADQTSSDTNRELEKLGGKGVCVVARMSPDAFQTMARQMHPAMLMGLVRGLIEMPVPLNRDAVESWFSSVEIISQTAPMEIVGKPIQAIRIAFFCRLGSMNDDDVAPLALAASPIVRGPIWTIEATEIFCQKLLQFGFGDAGTSFESLLNTFLKDSLNRRTLADCINRSEDRNFRNGLLFLAWHGCALNSPGKPSETADRLLAVIRLCDGVKILPEQSLGQLARLVGIPFYCTRIRSTVLHLVLPWDKKPLVDPPITGAAVRCLLGHRDQVPAAVTRRLPKVSFVGDADGG